MKIILVAHGFLARELLHSAEMICGKQDNVQAVEFLPGQGTVFLKEKFSEYTKNSLEEEVLFLVDVFGGTPYNVAAEFVMGNERVEAVTGASIPLLLEIFMLRNRKATIQDIMECVQAGKENYIRSCRHLLQTVREEELE